MSISLRKELHVSRSNKRTNLEDQLQISHGEETIPSYSTFE